MPTRGEEPLLKVGLPEGDITCMQALLRTRLARSDEAEGTDDEGFTLVEMVIAIGLIAIVFASVAAVLTSSLKALAIQKARTQGNEVATQAIEDLQRRSFDNLVLCAAPSGTAPAGLDDVVIGSGCTSTSPTYGGDPCNNVVADAPKAEYTCTRISVAYNVKRYISWVDDGHTSKRLAVFVKWTDNVGTHTVSQQSSLRAPTAASIIGLSNPTLSSPSVTLSNTVSNTGVLANPVSVGVTSTGLTATDRVFVTFWDRDTDGNQVIDSVPLTGDGTSWTGVIPSGYTVPIGSQFITFNAVRAKDGKSTATISQAASFCPPTDPNCLSTNLPQILSTSGPGTVTLTASGGITADFTVSATTQNVGPNGRVQVLLPTVGGIQAVGLTPNNGCNLSNCVWSGTISTTSGFKFATGSGQKFDFAAYQAYTAGSTTDLGGSDSEFRTVAFS